MDKYGFPIRCEFSTDISMIIPWEIDINADKIHIVSMITHPDSDDFVMFITYLS